MALPAGLYRKYKESTEFFKRWLLRARLAGVGATPRDVQEDPPLEIFERVVAVLAQQPTMLTPAQLRLWPRAIEALETAITLRARAALYFPARAGDSHAYFLKRLRAWLQMLQDATNAPVDEHEEKSDSPLDFSNFYDVLDLPDDYFADTSGDVVMPTTAALTIQPLTEAEKKRLFDEAFAEDLNAELACLFMELEELSEAVYAEFFAVKKQSKTLVEATAVAKVAIDSAAHVIAKLQLKYPAIRNAQDVMSIIQDNVPPEDLKNLIQDVLKAWWPDEKRGPARYRYVAGSLLVDMLWVAGALQSFLTAIPSDPAMRLVLRDGFAGTTYGEEETPHYVAPDPTSKPAFLMQQLPLLFNVLLANRQSGMPSDTSSFTGAFLDLFEQFFTTRTASVHLVFVCVCWVRSVAALQGDAGLSRNVGLSIMHLWDLEDKLSQSITHGEVRKADQSLHTEMEEALANMQQCDKAVSLLRANPLLAGCMQLDHHFRFLHLGTESTLITSRFRAFCHVYNALRDREFLDEIPFFEDALRVYEPMAFTPSRSAAAHGSFFRTYLVSYHMTDAAIDALMGRRTPPSERFASRVREYYHINDLSRVFKLLKEKDYSVLPATVSWKGLLGAVSRLCTQELFDTRVLSRDMLKVTDDLADLFESLCDALAQRGAAERLIEGGYPSQTRQYAVNRALEDVVTMPLLPLLDCINLDGTTSVTADTADLLRLESVRALGSDIGAEIIQSYCRRAAAVISHAFLGHSREYIESTYFTFPPTPNWSSLEFGDVSIHSEERSESTSRVFIELLEIFEGSDGPLSASQLLYVKRHLIADPGILAIATNDELCTLYHHASAGPARDRRLVEWMHQMGALFFQPKHCRRRPAANVLRSLGMPKSQMCNALAVHCAAKEGLVDMVRFLLEADHLHDLNTTTYHTRESLAHIAVKHGHREVYNLLEALGADMTLKDASGNYAYDYTRDAEWKRKILAVANAQRGQDAAHRAHHSRDEQFRIEGEHAAQNLRRQLETQRDEERAKREAAATKRQFGRNRPARQSSEPPPAEALDGATEGSKGASSGNGSSKKKKKNKKKKKPSGGESVDANGVANLMKQLLVNDGPKQDKQDASQSAHNAVDRIEQLARALEVLKDGSPASQAVKDASAKTAFDIVEALRTSVHRYVVTNVLRDTTKVMKRDAVDAAGAISQLSKFYRQLTDSPGPRRDERSLTALEKLKNRSGQDFSSFLTFAVHTSQVLVACGRNSQAKEVLDLVERRLLKMRPRPPMFRTYVELFADARRVALLEPITGSSAEAQREFEWYANDYDIPDGQTLIQLDMLHGCSWFLRLQIIEGSSSPAFERFLAYVDRHKTAEKDGIFIEDSIIAGTKTQEQLTEVHEFLRSAAEATGLHFSSSDRHMHARKLDLFGFEFTAKGIVRAKRGQAN